MKKNTVFAVLLLLCLLPVLAFAQNEETVIQKGDKTIIIRKSAGDLAELDELKKLNIDVQMKQQTDASPDAPFLGIYPADLDFPKAQALNYPNTYGILVTGVVPNSPAYQYRLAEEDIIMELNGQRILNLKEFDKLKAVYRAGDTVKFKVFRRGDVFELDFTFGSRETRQPVSTPETPKKPKKSAGYGGASWTPMWYNADMVDVNQLITSIGFSKLPEDGVLTHGFAFKGNVGKGWMLGGQFQFYGDSKKVNEGDYINSMDYSMFVGGATLEKRIPITRNFITSMGLMIGGASHSVDLVRSNGDYYWPSAGQTTQDIMDGNTYANISKGYILVQPKFEMMYSLLSWLALRGEVGYIYGYGPTSGWKISHNDTETYELKNSPDTPFEGFTVSIGPWFGF
jgi:hypothetical protein